MDFNQIKELLKELITENTSTEDVQKIGAISQELEHKEREEAELLQKHEDLRKKYIEAVKDISFEQKPKEEESKPKTFEQCVQEEIEKRK